MNLNLERPTLSLDAGQVVALDDAEGSRISARLGTVWVTFEGSIKDVILGPGESIIVAVNFGSKETPLRVRTGRRWTVLFDTHERPTTELVGDDHLTLAPHEAIILVAG